MQVKFPERTLKFKVAAGGSAERDLWVGALQAAHEDHTAAQQARRSGAGKLEKLQKVRRLETQLEGYFVLLSNPGTCHQSWCACSEAHAHHQPLCMLCPAGAVGP
jgi:hypothetical protein